MGEIMIDKNEIYVQLGLLEESLAYTLGQISTVRDALDESLKENATIRMENEKLRERLAYIEKKEEKASSKSKDEPNPNLIQIFNEGFHVCHLHYAERLQDGENCLDCLELLYR